MKKIFPVLIVSIFYTLNSFSQVEGTNDIFKVKIDTTKKFRNLEIEKREIVPEKSLAFNVAYGVPFLKNDLTSSDFWERKTGTAMHLAVDFRKQLKKEKIVDDYEITVPTGFAIGVGLGVSYYNKKIYFDNFSENLLGIYDYDDTKFNAFMSYKNIEESANFTYLDIPLYIEYGKPYQTKLNGWVKLGIKTSLLIANKFSGTGTYTSTGYYPEWDVELHNIPNLGLYTDRQSYEDAEYKFSPFVIWGCLSGGINIPFTSFNENRLSKFILRVGGNLEYTLTSVSKKSAAPFFSGASYRINQSNLLGGDGSRMLALKLEIGLIYCL